MYVPLNSKDEIIAITKIELDADVMTIIPSRSKLDNKLGRIVLLLHSYNVTYANQLFNHQIKTLQYNLTTLRNLVKVLSMPVALILYQLHPPSTISVFSILLSSFGIHFAMPALIVFLQPFITPVILSAILHRYRTHIFFKLMPKIIVTLMKRYLYVDKGK